MFEYFENQVGDLPIPQMSPEDEHQLGNLGCRAHELFRIRYRLVEAIRKTLYGVRYQELPFSNYHDLAGRYGAIVSYTSPDPNALGCLLALRVEATKRCYRLLGEITADLEQAEAHWSEIAIVEVLDNNLRRMLLFRALYLTEFDEAFRPKRRLSGSEPENLLDAALRVLSAPIYDADMQRNLGVLGNLLSRVEASEGTVALEEPLLEAKK